MPTRHRAQKHTSLGLEYEKSHCGSSGRAACPVFRRLSTRQLSRQTSLAGLQNAESDVQDLHFLFHGCMLTRWHSKGTPYAKRSVTKPHSSKLIQAHMQRKNVPSHMDELKSHKLQFFKDLSKIGSPIPSKCAYSKPKIVAKAYHK